MAFLNHFGDKTAETLYEHSKNLPIQKENGRTDSFNHSKDDIVFRNDSGEEMPPYACFKVDGAELDNKRYVVIARKTNDTGGPFLFNGDRKVEAGSYGVAQLGVVRAAYSGGIEPGKNELWGPGGSSWELRPSATGGFQPAIVTYGTINPNVTPKLLFGNTSLNSQMMIFQAPVGGIPKRNGSVLGWASVEIFQRQGFNLDSTNQFTIVYNWVTQDVCTTGDRYGVATTDIYRDWYVHAADCNDS